MERIPLVLEGLGPVEPLTAAAAPLDGVRPLDQLQEVGLKGRQLVMV